MTHQPSGLNKRRPRGPVQPAFFTHTARCTTRQQTKNIVICWSAVVVYLTQPYSTPQTHAPHICSDGMLVSTDSNIAQSEV